MLRVPRVSLEIVELQGPTANRASLVIQVTTVLRVSPAIQAAQECRGQQEPVGPQDQREDQDLQDHRVLEDLMVHQELAELQDQLERLEHQDKMVNPERQDCQGRRARQVYLALSAPWDPRAKAVALVPPVLQGPRVRAGRQERRDLKALREALGRQGPQVTQGHKAHRGYPVMSVPLVLQGKLVHQAHKVPLVITGLRAQQGPSAPRERQGSQGLTAPQDPRGPVVPRVITDNKDLLANQVFRETPDRMDQQGLTVSQGH